MNLFIKGPNEDHVVKCHGCWKNVFLHDAHTHQGSHWCMDCVAMGKHKGQGFGPVRFSK